MENLPEKRNESEKVALAVYQPKPGTKAIELRRQMVQLPEIARALNEVDKFVFAASTKTLISEMDDLTLGAKTKQMFKFIAMDVGFKIPNELEEWQYICTRLFTVLKRYYSQLTLADIKLAFELASMGELDDYLPKMSNGEPDKNHYQQFNPDYFGKILNAYKAKQSSVFFKARKALPKPEKKISPEEIAKYHNEVVDRCKNIFLQYKYNGELNLQGLENMFVYEWLCKKGFAQKVEGTKEDREKAYFRYLQRVASGFGSKWDGIKVRREGIESKEIDRTVFEIARDKEIKRAFDQMIEDEIFINNFLDYK